MEQEQKNRLWERTPCLLPCHLASPGAQSLPCEGRIINIGRAGVMVESDRIFRPGEQISLLAPPHTEQERFTMPNSVTGTVRWGHLDPTSLMGFYYIGVEFDQLLPLAQAVRQD